MKFINKIKKKFKSRITVSVAIPTYKENPYIWDAVSSLRNQSGKQNVQILIGVNGKDYAWYEKLLDYYKNMSDVEVYYTETVGVSAGRNVALAHAKGQYVTFLDDDDYLAESYIEDSIALFEEGVDIVCMPLMNCNISGEPLKDGADNYINNAMIKQYAKSSYATANTIPQSVVTTIWGKIYRKSVIDELTPFREDVLVSEDVVFWAQNSVKVKGKFHLQDASKSKSWYMRRIVPNSLSRVADTEKFIKERQNCLNELEKILEGDCIEKLVKSHIKSQKKHIENARSK